MVDSEWIEVHLFMIVAFLVISSAENCPSYPVPVPINIQQDTTLQSAFASLNNFLSAQQKQLNFPGLVATVVYDQEMVWHSSYGVLDPFSATMKPITIDNGIRIASITKVFTDLMLLKMRDAGKVSLDDPVHRYMPKFSVLNPYNTSRPLTLRQLASHTSGLQREVPCPWYDMTNCTEEEILKRISNAYLVYPQDDTPHYSNLGLALLGRTLEKRAGELYEDYVQKEILKPLGMNHSSFSYEGWIKENMAIGVAYTSSGKKIPAPIRGLGWGNPMGGLISTAREMTKLISFMFRTNQTAGGDQILDGSTINEMLLSVIEDHDGVSAFGMPWEFQYVQNYWIKSVTLQISPLHDLQMKKAGELDGYRSQVALVQPLKLGIFIAATDASDDYTQSMLTIPSLEILIPAFEKVLWSLQPVVPLPPNANTFTGVYRLIDPLYGPSDMIVYVEGSTMYAANLSGGQKYNAMNMTQFNENTFRVLNTFPEGCRWQNDGTNHEFIYFVINGDGKSCSELTFMGQVFKFLHK